MKDYIFNMKVNALVQILFFALLFNNGLFAQESEKDDPPSSILDSKNEFEIWNKHLKEGMAFLQNSNSKEAINKFILAKEVVKDQKDLIEEYKLTVSSLAFAYNSFGDYNEAIKHFKEFFRLFKEDDEKDDILYVNSLQGLISIYLMKGEIDKTLSLAESLEDLSKKIYDETSPDFSSCLYTIINVYQANGFFEKAILLNLKLNQLNENLYGKSHTFYIQSLGMLANSYVYSGDIEKAQTIGDELLSYKGEMIKAQNFYGIATIANIYVSLGNHDKAIILNKELLVLNEKAYGKESVFYVQTLTALVGNFYSALRVNESKPYLPELIELSKKVYTKKDPNYAAALYSLGNAYHGTYKLKEAYQAMHESVELNKSFFGKEHPNYLFGLNSLLNIHLSMGNTTEALMKVEELIDLNEKINKKGSVNYATYLATIANVFQTVNQLDKAEPVLEELVSINKEFFGVESAVYLNSLSSLAHNYNFTGKNDLALVHVDEILKINDIVYGDSNEFYAVALYNVANIYKTNGKIEEAYETISRALELNESFYGKNHINYAGSLEFLASLKVLYQDYEEALDMYKSVKSIYAEIYGTSHAYYFRVVNSVNQTELLIGQNEKMRGSIGGNVAIVEKTFKYHALIIAVQDYAEDSGIMRLDYPISDAKKLESVLVNNYTFDQANVNYMPNPKRKDIIDELKRLALTLTENDHLLIFYAGHGAYDELLETGYWQPSDATRDSQSNWLSRNDVVQYVRALKTRHVLLISDACYSGSIFGYKQKSVDNKVLDKLLQYNGRHAMTSALDKRVPDDSRFMKALIAALNENSSSTYLSSLLFNTIKTSVMWNTDNTPQFAPIKDTNHEGGEFVFIKRE